MHATTRRVSRHLSAVLALLLLGSTASLSAGPQGSVPGDPNDPGAAWEKLWGRPAIPSSLIVLEPDLALTAKDSRTRWRAIAYEGTAQVGVGRFVEIDGSRSYLLTEDGELPDGRTLSVKVEAVAGALSGSSGQASTVAGTLITVAIDGEPSAHIFRPVRQEPTTEAALATIARVKQLGAALAAQRSSGLPVSSSFLKGPGNPAFPAFQPGACDNPGSGDSCRVGYCECSEDVVAAYFSDLPFCARSIVAAILSCGCVTAGGPLGIGCILTCLSSLAGVLGSCFDFIFEVDESIADLEACRNDAIDCYCTFQPGQYPLFCRDWWSGNVPLRAQVAGLVPGERVTITGKCKLPDFPNLVVSQSQVTIDRADAFIEIHSCAGGQLYELNAGRVDTPHVVPGSERTCSPPSYSGSVPGKGAVDHTFDCTCAPPWTFANCPRVPLRASVTGLETGESYALGALMSSPLGSWPDVLLLGQAATNTDTMAMGIGFPGGEILDFYRVSGPERCEIQPADVTIDGDTTNQLIARVRCDCDEQRKGPLGGDCGPGGPEQFSVGGTAEFNSLGSGAVQGSVTAVLNGGEQQVVVTVNDGAEGFTFPELLADDDFYEVTARNASDDANCSIFNGNGFIEGENVTDVQINCVVFPDDICDVFPEICIIDDPICLFSFRSESTLVFTTDFEGDILGSELITYTYLVAECSGFARSQGASGLTEMTETTGPFLYLRTDLDPPASGTIVLRGVARDDEEGIASVRVFIDGQQVSLSGFGIDRPDEWTCSEIPSPGCQANSAFWGTLDTTTLSDGPHQLTIGAINGDELELAAAHETTFVVDNSGGDPCDGDSTGPSVALTSPADGAELPVGTHTLTASAADPNGVDRVRFFVDNVAIATDRSAPFSASWNATVGTHTLKARAWDQCGNPRWSSVVTVTVEASDPCELDNEGPTITFSTPADGSTHPEGTVNVSITANDPSGVESAQLYVDDAFHAADFSSPFGWSWNAPVGAHTLRAEAIDNCGNEGTSDTIQVTIEEADPCDGDASGPSVSLTSPANGDTLPSGFNTLTATASDANGVDKVQFYVDGALHSTDFNAPFSASWNATVGPHTLKARAWDQCGNPRWSSVVTVTVEASDPCELDNEGPTITFSTPADGSTHPEGTVNVSITANDPSGVESAQLYVDDAFHAADFSSPFGWSWNAPVGAHTLRAEAIDNCGNEGTSDTIQVTIEEADPCDGDTTPPTVSITEPANGSEHEPGTVTIRANASDANGIDRVEFYVDGVLKATDFSAPYSHFWADGTRGTHVLKARAFDSCGNNRWSSEITVELGPGDPEEPPL